MQNIDIKLKPSSYFISLIGLVLVGSVAISVSLPLSVWGRGMLTISALAYGIRLFWCFGFMKSAYSIIGLELLAGSSCQLRYPLHTIVAEIKKDSTVTPILCVLRFTVPGRRWRPACVIFKDSLSREKYRQLLVWLRCC